MANNRELYLKTINRIDKEYDKASDMIEKIKNDCIIELSNFVRECSAVSKMSENDINQLKLKKADQFNHEYTKVLHSNLSALEYEKTEDKLLNDRHKDAYLYEKYAKLSPSEQKKELDSNCKKIEKRANEHIIQIRNDLIDFVIKEAKKTVAYLDYILAKNNNQKEIYDVYHWMTFMRLNDSELTEIYRKNLSEALMNYPNLERIIISYGNINIGDIQIQKFDDNKGLQK